MTYTKSSMHATNSPDAGPAIGLPAHANFAISLGDVASTVGTSAKIVLQATFDEAVAVMKQQPTGRGVVVVRQDQSVMLVISPRRVQEILQNPAAFAKEGKWYEGLGSTPLILAINTPANLAIEAALRRNEREKYEPVMTVDSAGRAIVIELAVLMQHQLSTNKPAERALRAIRTLNKEDGQRRARFLAALSHELRSPLTSILGYCDLLADQPTLGEQAMELVSVIRRGGQQLETLLSNLMDLSELERGQRTLRPTGVDVQPLVQACVLANAEEAKARGLEQEVVYHMPMAADLYLDASAVQQLISLLIQGTIRAAGEGVLRVHVKLRWAGGAVGVGGCMLVLQVEAPVRMLACGPVDAGRQLPSESLAGDCDLSLNFAIANRLVELMGGELLIQSGAGQQASGAATMGVEVTLPLQAVPMDQLLYGETIVERVESMLTAMPGSRRSGGEVTGELLAGKRILVAEDGSDNQRLIRMVLEKSGAKVEITPNGRLAVDKALEGNLGEPYALVMLDMQMPEMDGYEAARTLRQSGYVGPIVALTAHALSSDRAKCLAAGCDDYVAKPIDRRMLIKVCERWVRLGMSVEHGAQAK